ncbi:MAG: hypothetical protein FRX48_02120 [Lasallia pustulata]|uniref:Uncharacterized protein n=1 Tax=Lasallia pustulata TaxID=136370 RepID=A0A5M8PXD1_9LECA|nr:MAG: hypothetical protein FRX48_02120 [Lasallia pustulata]
MQVPLTEAKRLLEELVTRQRDLNAYGKSLKDRLGCQEERKRAIEGSERFLSNQTTDTNNALNATQVVLIKLHQTRHAREESTREEKRIRAEPKDTLDQLTALIVQMNASTNALDMLQLQPTSGEGKRIATASLFASRHNPLKKPQ